MLENRDKQEEKAKDLPNQPPKPKVEEEAIKALEKRDIENNNALKSEGQNKDKGKVVQSEINHDIDSHNQHHLKIINYTNSNRSAPNESYYDYKDHIDNLEEIHENIEEEEAHKENKNKIVEELENIEDDIIIINNDTIREEKTIRMNHDDGKNDIEFKSKNKDKSLNVRSNEKMGDIKNNSFAENELELKRKKRKEDE